LDFKIFSNMLKFIQNTSQNIQEELKSFSKLLNQFGLAGLCGPALLSLP
jgi:hypothetical protein